MLMIAGWKVDRVTACKQPLKVSPVPAHYLCRAGWSGSHVEAFELYEEHRCFMDVGLGFQAETRSLNLRFWGHNSWPLV